MIRIYVALEDSVAVISGQDNEWDLAERFKEDVHPECLAVDPHHPERVYCGTMNKGLWKSDDAGNSWSKVGAGVPHAAIMSVAVSSTERKGKYSVVWVGTEPSSLYRSEDGGETWTERPSLLDLPSKPTWKFPPRPYTHHVRWIQPDPIDEERIFVAIELGGVMRSSDKGLTWEDRKPGSQYDGHTLTMHPKAPGRLYEAAGGENAAFRPIVQLAIPPVSPRVIMRNGGYAESLDGGTTWKTLDEGLDGNHYLWGLAVDCADPHTVLASAAIGPMQAHRKELAESYLIRRTEGQPWRRVQQSFDSKGTVISVLTASKSEAGVFYAANNKGIFRSQDAGEHWQLLPVKWPERYLKHHVQSIVVVE